MSDNETCLHSRQYKVIIGYSPNKDCLVYKMSACFDCGKYIDTLGYLANFEKDVTEKLGREWKWKETHMDAEELASWKPEGNTRMVFIPYEKSGN